MAAKSRPVRGGASRPETDRHRRPPCTGLIFLTAASCSLAPDAFAQLAGGGLTDSGLFGGSGARSTVESLVAGQPRVSTGLPWTFGGDVDLEVGATDSPGGAGGGWQLYTLLAPDFYLNGSTRRLTASVYYSPRLSYYPSSSSQTLLSNTFNGSATYEVIPDYLFFNLRGIGGVSSRFGSTSLASNSFFSTNDAVQTTSFSASPYINHTFDGWGTLTAGYTYSRTYQNGYGSVPPVSGLAPNAAATAGFGTTGNLATNSEFATITSGENLGRIQDSVSVLATQNSGDPIYQGSSTFVASNTASYALYRWLTVLGSIGYEEYRYPNAGYSLSEPTWTVGATLTPNADSSLTVQYGRVAGSTTVLFDGTYAPTARTRVYGSYTVGIETGLGARQNLLASTVVGPGGLLLDRVTGAPVLANSALASQFTLSRVKTLSVGGALLLDRDSFSVSVYRTEATQLANSINVLGIPTNAGTTTDSTYGTLGWQHDLNPSTNLYTSVSYGVSNTGVFFGNPGSSQDTFQVYTGLTHTFTETLSGSVSYSHAERFGGAISNVPSNFGGTASQNLVLVGLRKNF
jgi:uncharacterized protein (PEP-CTERM system associated)